MVVLRILCNVYLAGTPQAGFEPATSRLTVDCSTAELLRKVFQDFFDITAYFHPCIEFDKNILD